ncbi:DUF397 domain-containing protein [Actinosynnema sp. NPDC020468]|uniref:DUF397 domain-containing protein n=1 Tax=Actinosynnema sp. NPDC020468 TaxID=3154488 RepID=UPI0033D47ADC
MSLNDAVWRKSSRSGGGAGAQCVEVAVVPDLAGVRDSKNVDGPVLRFTSAAFSAFLTSVRR